MTNSSPPGSGLFMEMPAGRRVWAVAAVHGEANSLAALHRELERRTEPGDQVVYLGNLMGRGAGVVETIDELLLFRRAFIARPRAHMRDLIVLRGCQEEMWHKLLQLQFAVGPKQVLEWMLDHGVAASIEAYGGSPKEGMMAAGQGARAISQWTSSLRSAQRKMDGHGALMSALHHAAFSRDRGLLLVSSGIDPDRPLSEQTDSFWWGGRDFDRLEGPFGGFGRVVRGYDPSRGGPRMTEFSLTLDAGCGFGGSLAAVLMGPAGEILETLEA